MVPNLGIGTTSPGATLDVAGTVKLGAAGTADTIAVNLSVANSVAVTLKCMWMQ